MTASRVSALTRRLLSSATLMYMLALAMGGAAVLLTVFLPPGERGSLVATTTSATIGVAVGGLSLETFFLAQGRSWLEASSSLQSFLVYFTTVPLSAALAWAFAAYSAEGSAAGAALGGAILAFGTIPAAAGLSNGDFLPVYRNRALFATAIPALYLLLAALSVRTAATWLLCWFVAQGVLATTMWLAFGGQLIRSARKLIPFARSSLTRILVTHAGAVAIIFALRFDQLALSRFRGAEMLAIYSLAIAATEFTQAGAVVSAQRVLSDSDDAASGARLRRALRNTTLFATGISVLIVAGLALIGLISQAYAPAVLIGALLLPRSVFLVIGKVLSARLVNRNGEAMAALIALATSVLALIGYNIVVPRFGAVGTALLAGGLFAAHSAATAVALRTRKPAERGTSIENGVGELV